ncbi:bifunctional hydroxymethylpyrimidine kinase/phosphomethylpyrimidine kinase [Rhodobacteraceae bacterium 2376]|uniref:hydroxymethylpyrimidine kinase n=1 Tax=Rhabdonatronobacter sediminivivens TaxID=2743469 RepID=A0A7Z0I0U5_9RHOB|nr:bifunctional hydroxymethylpyrimidine kinase/phosphomethylpyrimidine kinase [Rhabdonatronobacter sediminivivens]NYS25854.1 bifunctional hydroxymethylpyrimidine kinase/phosphomethylpyrimidine kinase [Rhabdonatronobacter sediminivivens]
MTPKAATPIALTIAGSDSGGGAGIQADLKAFSALGVYGASVITALTAQNTRAVTLVEPASPAMIAAQIAAVFDDLDIRAAKLGMLGGAEAIETVANALQGHDLPLVLDPVMVAKSGDRLLPAEALDALRTHLLPRATLLTPNLPEAADLLGTSPATSEDTMAEQGRALCDLGAGAVLMKGGHAQGDTCVDLLITANEMLRLTAPRQRTRNTHGTGCTLSAAIAAGLAKGAPLPKAVTTAHDYLQRAIAAADTLGVGTGHGPVHHFHQVWRHG